MKISSRPAQENFPNRRPLSYLNLTKTTKTYVRFKLHNKSTPKHKTIKTTTDVSPWNDQFYKTTGSVYLSTSPWNLQTISTWCNHSPLFQNLAVIIIALLMLSINVFLYAHQTEGTLYLCHLVHLNGSNLSHFSQIRVFNSILH